MSTATNQRSWQLQVQDWLSTIFSYRRGASPVELRAIAEQYIFPKSVQIAFANWLSRELAGWIVKWALRNAARELGFTLTDAEADLLTEVALGFI